jgi:hypothetical protein
MGNIIPDNYLAPPSQPWGREITQRLQALENRLDGSLADTSTSAGQISSTLDYLVGNQTFITQGSTVGSSTTVIGSYVNLSTETLTFSLSRKSKVLINFKATWDCNGTSNYTSYTNLRVSGIAKCVFDVDGSQNTSNDFNVNVDLMTNTLTVAQTVVCSFSRIVVLDAGTHTVQSNWRTNMNSVTSALSKISNVSIIAQVIG